MAKQTWCTARLAMLTNLFGRKNGMVYKTMPVSVSKKFDTLPGGIPYPLDTPLVPGETSGDTPGFAPRWARVEG